MTGFKPPSNLLSDEAEAWLFELGFKKYSGVYEGCPLHGAEDISCTCSGARGGPYWVIDGRLSKTFINGLHGPAIVYLFVEKNRLIRKIGEGLTNRPLGNMKAHYNHGPTRSPHTQENRRSGNQIAIQCRQNGKFFLFVLQRLQKTEAREIEKMLKSRLRGWLDYDQGSDGTYPIA